MNEFDKWSDCSIDSINNQITMVVPGGYITITLETIQTACKWTDRHYTVLVLDELHTQASEVHSNIFENLTYDFVVGMTATLDVKGKIEKQEIYDKYCPLVYSFLEGEENSVVN